MSQGEKEYIMETRGTPFDSNMSVPWFKLLSSIRVWAIVINHFSGTTFSNSFIENSANWAFYILLTWMPTYLKNELHFNLNNSGFIGLLPYIGCLLVAIIAGRVGDFMLQVLHSYFCCLFVDSFICVFDLR